MQIEELRKEFKGLLSVATQTIFYRDQEIEAARNNFKMQCDEECHTLKREIQKLQKEAVALKIITDN